MFELIGLIFGGVSRLGQYWMELAEKSKERDHEARMFDLQMKLQSQRIEAEKEIRQMEVTAKRDEVEIDALMTALQSQTAEAKSAGGWVLKLSASVRPIITFWLLGIYSASKVSALSIMLTTGATLSESVRASYTEFDGTLLASVVSFYFINRSLLRTR